MPVNRDSSSPMYRLGRVWALVGSTAEIDGDSEALLDLMLTHPLRGLAAIGKIAAAIAAGDADGSNDLDDGIAQILGGISDLPNGPLPVEEQGPFWLGYYHQRTGQRLALSVEELQRAGRLLYGDQWQSELSRELGQSSTRRMREWIQRGSVPTWACAEIYALLMTRSRAAGDLAKELLNKADAAERG